uniref:Uncharacterized protein n=1 Tax=Oryza brachyantha TaxID=4533 RepID=J3LNI1_ORYBR
MPYRHVSDRALSPLPVPRIPRAAAIRGPIAAQPQEFAEPSTRRRFRRLSLSPPPSTTSPTCKGSTVASRVSCSSGNNGIFPPCLLPGFLGFPVVFVNFHLFKAIVRSPASSVVLGIRGGRLP